jgi:hypothetical protein
VRPQADLGSLRPGSSPELSPTAGSYFLWATRDLPIGPEGGQREASGRSGDALAGGGGLGREIAGQEGQEFVNVEGLFDDFGGAVGAGDG